MAIPSYIAAFKTNALQQRVKIAKEILKDCRLCPRRCGVNRACDEKGFCRTGKNAIICSALAHQGEEPPLSGTKGSGTIFFSRCHLKCLYCQNYDFSQQEEGRETTTKEMARIMLTLQKEGCHNINLVTPSNVLPQNLEALIASIKDGLNIPLVYNTSGYELVETLRLLDGIVDIYLPDMRYASKAHALKYSNAPDYPAINQEAVREMFRQVGTAQIDEEGIITRGLVIRHLVLPQDISGTEEIFSFIAKEITPLTYISLMSQYFPAYQASRHPPMDRRITPEEYDKARSLLIKYGLENGWIQESWGVKRFAGIHIKKNI